MSFRNKQDLCSYLDSIKTLNRQVSEPEKVGTYDLLTEVGSGIIYDRILEFRVWIKEFHLSVYCQTFKDFSEMIRVLKNMKWSKKFDHVDICMLVEQKMYYELAFKADPKDVIPGLKPLRIAGYQFVLVKKEHPRIAEWRVEWESL